MRQPPTNTVQDSATPGTTTPAGATTTDAAVYANEDGERVNGPQVANPNRANATLRLRQRVSNKRAAGRRVNTARTFDPKIKEWEEFCSSECESEQAPCQVTTEKVQWFMFYQAFREKKKTGGKKKH